MLDRWLVNTSAVTTTTIEEQKDIFRTLIKTVAIETDL